LLRRARDDAERSDGKGSARGSEEGDGAQSPQSQQSPAKDSAAEAEAAAAAAAAAAEKEKAEREKAEKEKAEKEKAAVRCRPLLCYCSLPIIRFIYVTAAAVFCALCSILGI